MMHTVLNPNSWNQFTLRIPLLAHPVHGFGSVQTVRWTPEFSLARPVHRALGLEDQIKRCAANPNDYEILNYQRQNGFNPLQCSVQSLFNVFHLPSNHKVKPTLHTSFCLQPQYAEAKEKLTSVQQTLELTFSSREPSLPPLWNNSFTGKCNSKKLHHSHNVLVFNRFCVFCVLNNVCVICSLWCGFCINPWFTCMNFFL